MPRRSRQKPLGPTIPSPADGGGLFHDPDAFPGSEAFNLYAPNGQRIARWYAIEGETDTELIEAFLEFLSRKHRKLRLIPPSSSQPLA